jgi:hypothetical protein
MDALFNILDVLEICYVKKHRLGNVRPQGLEKFNSQEGIYILMIWQKNIDGHRWPEGC